MAKNIKKSYKYLIIIAGIIFVLPTIIFSFIRIPAVQTLLIQRITSHLSEKISSSIYVGKIDYLFFNRLSLNEILIKDKNDDTLIYAPKASIGIKHIDLRNKSLTFGKVTVTSPVVAFITDTTGEMNLTWYLDKMRNQEDTIKKGKSTIKINQIELTNARFSLIDKRRKTSNIPTDFSNLRLSGINANIEDFLIHEDTTSFSIDNLTFLESAGFHVNRMDSKVILTNNDILFHSGIVNCDSSILNISRVRFLADSITGFKNFRENVILNIWLDKSLVSTSDLKYFVPSVKEINESIWLSGKVTGTLTEFRGRNIDITYGDYTRLSCDFDLSGLPEIQNSFIYLGINNLTTNAKDIDNINIPGKALIKLPEILYTLGNVSFDGSFTGFLEDFVAYGNIRTKDGTISTDISLRPEEKNKFKVNGLVRGSSIAIGRLTGKTDMFGNLSMKADIDGYAYPTGKFNGKLTGLIDSIEMNNYKYRNISLNGIFTEKTWDGNVKIDDKNIKFDILGMFDFSSKLPEFDFTLNLAEADLHMLNFDKSDTSSALSMLVTANFRGSNIDNLDGEIKLLNSNLHKYGSVLELYDFSLKTFNENNRPAISLRTDYVDADLRGYYNFSALVTAIKSAISYMMPSRFPAPAEKKQEVKNDFTFNINLKNTDKISNFFRTGILLSEKSNINGTILSDTIMNISANTNMLNFKGIVLHDMSLNANLLSPELQVKLNSSSLDLLGQSELKGFNAIINTVPDNFIISLNWDNKDPVLSRGNFIARGSYIKSAELNHNPVLNIDIDSTGIYSRNNLWKISPSHITNDSSTLSINKLYVSNKENYYLVDGTISKNHDDTLHLEFKGIDISWLNALTTRKNIPDQVSLSFKGKLNGNVLLSNLYYNPLLETNLNVMGFSILQSDYGDLSIISAWNNEKKVADIRASNNLEGKKMLDINGFYDPSLKRLDLTGIANKLPIDALNPLLKVFASGIAGTATGKVRLSGETKNLALEGALMAENASMKIDYLQTKYKVNDSIRFEKDNFVFKNVRVTDEKGNPATLNGSVHYKQFKKYTADLMITTNEAMVLNTRPKDNDLFYGTAYATGVTTIKSGPGTLSFDVSAKTGKNTKFYIPLNTSETVSDYSFVTFVNKDTTQTSVKKTETNTVQPSSTSIELNFDLEVTPDAEVQLIFDPKVGDIMKGHGSAKNLTISYDKQGNFRIYGDYILEDGDYLFTLKNIMNKPFSVEDGGRIIFNGDIDNAEIEMKAIYKLKASLYEILKDEKFKEKIPVECQIDLSGKLFNPIVAFNIYLPLADEETRTYLKNVISTEEELSRQFLYLLVMNSFYSDPSYGTSLTSTTTTGTSAMAVTTTEMLSNQLSNWLSQISNDFDVGFTYTPGQKNFNDQEVQVALSTQLLDDRVVINGNLDVRGMGGVSNNTDQLTGDFDIEYKPKFSTRLRFKVFNRFNNPYTGKQAPYTQGFGIFFKQDFDKFSDLFKKKLNSEMKKEEKTTLPEN
ncbi:MAG: translocation/assembly module TamB domain-containing protein [Bacteroidia bacterium]|nr:translocation/assembly module TamB domain-containing protein [Bacteroidia bacterium]